MVEEFALSQASSDVQKAIDNALNPDTTLSIRNKLADAKSVGDEVRTLSENKLNKSDLPTVINNALALAKESGEFDGADGVSVTHKWNGTVLEVTSASGTASADLKGVTGPAGKDGASPVRGTDYWTEEDKAEIVNDVLASLPAAEGVSF